MSIIGKILNLGLQAKLENLISHHEKTGYSMGRDIHITIRAVRSSFEFQASVMTGDESLTGFCLSNSCFFYNSKKYPDLSSIFIDTTKQVAAMQLQLSQLTFLRTFYLQTEEEATRFYEQYTTALTQDGWLEKHIKPNSRFGVQEKFINGSWRPHLQTEEEDTNWETANLNYRR